MSLIVVGLNHRTVPVELLERMTVPEHELPKVLHDLLRSNERRVTIDDIQRKVAEHFKAFRHGESEFYDTYRRLLDSPETFGPDEDSQLKRYFEEVEIIRRFVRNAETDSLPMVEDMHVNSVVKSN